MYGELIPIGGGDSIPLLKPQLLVGRRESCDIVLRFANVSAHHCQLIVENGYLYVKDMHSSNGVKINDVRLDKGQQRRLSPGDTLAVAKHRYRVDYDPAELGAVGPPPAEDVSEEIMSESLLQRAGLNGREIGRTPETKRYDVTSNKSGQIKLPHQSL